MRHSALLGKLHCSGRRSLLNTVVYYPHISPSPDWLKLAALCWNRVYRLVPEDWGDHFVDDLEIDKLDRELGGILRSINARGMASSGLEEKFINWVEKHKEKLKNEKLYQYY